MEVFIEVKSSFHAPPQTVNEQIQNNHYMVKDSVTCFDSRFGYTRDLEQERMSIGNHAAR